MRFLLALIALAGAAAASPYEDDQKFGRATCPDFVIGAWNVSTPRVYGAGGEHVGGGDDYTLTYKADGTFTRTAPAEGGGTNEVAGRYSASPGSQPFECNIYSTEDPQAKAMPLTTTWQVLGPDQMGDDEQPVWTADRLKPR